MEIKKKHARELVTSSSFARSSNTFLMLILIFISTFALISFFPKRARAAYENKIGSITLQQSKEILNFYSGDLYYGTSTKNQQIQTSANNIMHSITSNEFMEFWNTEIVELMSGESIFDTYWEKQVLIIPVIQDENNIILTILFCSNGENTSQISNLDFRVLNNPNNRLTIYQYTGPGYFLVEYYLGTNNNESTFTFKRKLKTTGSISMYQINGTNIQSDIEISEDTIYIPNILNLSQNKEFKMWYGTNSSNRQEYYLGNFLQPTTNYIPINGNSGYTGTITNESGEIIGNISGEVDNSNIIDTLTQEANMEDTQLTSGEIQDAVGIELTQNPYENFWYEFSTGLANALTASSSSMELDWLRLQNNNNRRNVYITIAR